MKTPWISAIIAAMVTPPLAEYYVDDGFGANNGVVVVQSKER